jgi:sugar lactone lactonase YvrE
MRRAIPVSLLLLAVLGAVAARAEHTRFWEQSSYEDFQKGTHKGIALRSDGVLMPAPEFKLFTDPNLAHVWALALDSRGRLYAAGGSDAKVLRIDPSGKATTVLESSELEAQALAVDKQDNVYAGTSPDGKVYKITPEGQHSVFFDPKSKYIWALAFDSRGNLFVATGDKGQVFVVAPDGKGQLFYKSEETHARSLAFDAQGNLLVGTDPSGLILRIPVTMKSGSAMPEAGKAFVIYETAKKEITSLATDAAGNIYAAGVGNKVQSQPTFVPQPNPAASTQIAAAIAAAAGAQSTVSPQAPVARAPIAPVTFAPFAGATGGSEVYKIGPDGSPNSLWSSPQDVVYALAFSPEKHVLLGTGNHGEVIELDGDAIFSSLASSDALQVTALAAGPGRAIYAATANPGKIFTLGPGYASEGTFESQTFDARILSRWGRLTWWGEPSKFGKIEFYVRSGNTSDPDNYWSPWEGPYSDSAGDEVHCPAARFVQWKAVFHAAPSGTEPNLSWVKIAYLRKNVAPVIDGIVVEPPGYRAQAFPGVPGEQTQAPAVVPFRIPQNPVAGEPSFPNFSEFQQHPQGFTSPPQGTRAKGYQAVLWTAHDDNGDHLVYKIYYRGEGEKDWKLLKDGIHENYYSWDTSSMPDGAYYLKLVASDAESNPQDQALTTERTSDRFLVDNTPPTIENLRAEPSSGRWHIRFTAQDSGSAIARTTYSLDAGHWEVIFPVGQLTDASVESYDVTLGDLKPGEHTIAVQVSDEFQNSATAKVTFTAPLSK